MKPKHIILLLVLVIVSCKVTEENVSGIYSSDHASSEKLKINKDHTFIYTDFDYINFLVKSPNIDSCYFITKGKWTLTPNELILNSFDKTYSDTNRVINIYKTSTKLKVSNFSFKDTFGNTIPFNSIDDERGNFAFIVDKTYSSYDVDLGKHNVLKFNFYTHKSWIFEIKDKTPTNYIVILAPYYKQSYFLNRILKVKRNKLLDSTKKFKRVKPVNNVTSPYIVHGPLHQ